MDKIEKQQDNIASHILDKMAGLGLLGAHMPEAYGGMQLDNNTNTLIMDKSQIGVLAESDTSILTLITCYPFDTVVPGGRMRYVVIAQPT